MSTLIVMGTRTRVHVKDGGIVRPCGAMMHDRSGQWWPKNSLLFGSYTAGREPPTEAQYKGAPREYLGKNYDPRLGSVDLPSRDAASWVTIGDVTKLEYVRGGTRAPGGYRHYINKPHGVSWFVFLVRGKGKAVLRRHGSFYRLDFTRGALIDDRGIVYP